MNRGRTHLSVVVDQVVAEANATKQRHSNEVAAIKIAEALPRTDLARGLRSLADSIRSASDDMTYADLARSS